MKHYNIIRLIHIDQHSVEGYSYSMSSITYMIQGLKPNFTMRLEYCTAGKLPCINLVAERAINEV